MNTRVSCFDAVLDAAGWRAEGGSWGCRAGRADGLPRAIRAREMGGRARAFENGGGGGRLKAEGGRMSVYILPRIILSKGFSS